MWQMQNHGMAQAQLLTASPPRSRNSLGNLSSPQRARGEGNMQGMPTSPTDELEISRRAGEGKEEMRVIDRPRGTHGEREHQKQVRVRTRAPMRGTATCSVLSTNVTGSGERIREGRGEIGRENERGRAAGAVGMQKNMIAAGNVTPWKGRSMGVRTWHGWRTP